MATDGHKCESIVGGNTYLSMDDIMGVMLKIVAIDG